MKAFFPWILVLCAFACAEWTARDVHELFLKRTDRKAGVHTGKLDGALDSAGLVAVYEFHRVMGDSYRPTVTSANDSPEHARFSKHYENKALDFRLFDVPRKKREGLVRAIEKQLGPRFRVLWENVGKSGEHLHIELKD